MKLLARCPRLDSLRARLAQALKSSLRGAQRGMTLIEIMVVMALIGVIGTVIAVSVSGSSEEAKIGAAKTLVGNIGNTLAGYYATRSEYPESLDVLVEQKKLKANQTKDPWGTALVYEPSGGEFKLCSPGPDKRAGSQDDICNAE